MIENVLLNIGHIVDHKNVLLKQSSNIMLQFYSGQ